MKKVAGTKAPKTTEAGDKKAPARRTAPRAPVRLWVKAAFVGFRRSHHTQNENQVLLRIQGVNTRSDSTFYFGKRVAYIYRAHNEKQNTKYRAIWGRVSRSHGNNGTVIARFRTNLPPRAIGSTVRVFLFPNRTL